MPKKQSRKLPKGERKQVCYYILAAINPALEPIAQAQNRSVNNLVETALLEVIQKNADRKKK